MDLSMVSNKAWGEFQDSYPAAFAFLQRQSLIGELNSLNITAEFMALTKWQKERKTELETVLNSETIP